MGSLQDTFVDKLISAAVNTHRAAAGVSNAALDQVHILDNNLAASIHDAEIDGVNADYYRQRRAENLIKDSADTIDSGMADARATAEASLLDVAKAAQDEFASSFNDLFTVDVSMDVLDDSELQDIVDSTTVLNASQNDWWDKLALDAKRNFSMGVRAGAAQRQAGQQLVNSAIGRRKVRATRAVGDQIQTFYQHSGGMMDRTKNDVESIVTTLAASVASAVVAALTELNSRFFNGKQAIAVLDNRTSVMCRGRDHMAWDGDGNPIESTGANFPYPGETPWHFRALVAGTRVLTSTGYKCVEDIKVGELVWTHKNRWRPVYATMGKHVEELVIRFNFEGGEITVTDEHPLLSGSRWFRADELKVGDQFVQYAQKPEQVVIISLLDCVSNNRPAGFNEEFIPDFYSCAVDSILHPCVEFETNSPRKHKIQNVSTERNLGLVGTFDVLHEQAFSEIGALPHPISTFDHITDDYTIDLHRVFESHPPRVHFEESGGTFRTLLEPVIFFSDSAIGLGFTHNFYSSFSMGSSFDTVTFALIAEDSTSQIEFPFNLSERFSQNPMLLSDQVPEFFGWNHTSILDVEHVYYKGLVYNLAVVEDETFVAEGIITHNCRTMIVPILKNFNQLKRIIPNLSNSLASELDGKATRKQTYQQWFGKQSKAKQLEILGPGRYDVYQTGKMSLADMLNFKGNPLTVEQLRAKAR